MDLLNYLHYIVSLTFVITQSSYLCFAQDGVFKIRRSRDTTVYDIFEVPASKCGGGSTPVNCNAYKAHGSSDDCHCGCPYSSSTFGFYSGSWTCLDNNEVRQLTGCNYKFEYELDSFPLNVLVKGYPYNAILSSGSCSIDSKSSQYFRCDGTWHKIGSQWFSITYIKGILSINPQHRYEVNVDNGISNDLLGRIIRLNITCDGQKPSCLLFKLEGTLQCSDNVTSATTRRPTSSSSTRHVSNNIPTTSSTSALYATTNPNNTSAEKDKVKSSGGSSTVVGVVVTLVIIVVIVIVIVAYVNWKRKSGESIWIVDQISSRVRKLMSSQPKKKTENSVDDPEYAEIPEEQQRKKAVDEAGGVYSYAFDDPQTAYVAPQPAPYNRLVHNHRVPDQEGAIYSTADDGHVYNVLERPPSAVNQMTSENLQSIQDLDPVYHVLQESMTTDETGDNESTRNDSHVVPKVRRKPPSPPRK